MTLLPLVIGLLGVQAPTPVIVPFHVAENAILVDGKVNGHTVTMLFDSGFGGTVLLSSAIDIGPATGSMHLRDFVGELEANTVDLKSLSIGGEALAPDEKIIVQQPGNFTASYGHHCDGILGLGAVKDKVVEIDFEHNQFKFYPAGYDITKTPVDGKKTFLSKLLPIGGNAMEMAVTTDKGQTMTMALDTGNAFYATSHKDVLERVGVWDDSKVPSYVRRSGVASGPVDSWYKKMPPLTIFGIPVQPTVWDIIDLPSSDVRGDGTVGFGFLSNFNITFDYSRRRVLFENWKTPIENEAPGDLGISARYDPEQKKTLVVLVSPGSPADTAGIKEDDEILSIGSNDMVRPTYQQLRAWFEGAVGSTCVVSISRDGALKRFNLTRQALVN